MATYRSLSGARFARIGRLARRLVIDERVSGLPESTSTVAATAGMDR
jgi:hypothetical protein